MLLDRSAESLSYPDAFSMARKGNVTEEVLAAIRTEHKSVKRTASPAYLAEVAANLAAAVLDAARGDRDPGSYPRLLLEGIQAAEQAVLLDPDGPAGSLGRRNLKSLLRAYRRRVMPSWLAASPVQAFVMAAGAKKPQYTAEDLLSRFGGRRGVDDGGGARRRLRLGDLAYVVMGGSETRERMVAVRRTWGPVDNPRVLLFSDAEDAELRTIVLGGPAALPGRENAQHKTMMGIRFAVEHGPPAPWTLLCDDDTYVYTNRLRAFLNRFDPAHPVLLGFSFRSFQYVPGREDQLVLSEYYYVSGGAGIAASRPAMEILAANLYTPLCPCVADQHAPCVNDLTISSCAWALGIMLVHSPMFGQHPRLYRPDSLTKHYLRPHEFYAEHAAASRPAVPPGAS